MPSLSPSAYPSINLSPSPTKDQSVSPTASETSFDNQALLAGTAAAGTYVFGLILCICMDIMV